MKNPGQIITISITLIISLMMFYPMSSTVTINKSDIISNRPFAGIISVQDSSTQQGEDLFVGTHISCMYWTNRENMKEQETFKVYTTPFLRVIGNVFKYKRLTTE